MRLYGITAREADAVLRWQCGCCAICERPSSQFKRQLDIDHDHKTGLIRGRLCAFCNHRVIGQHRDAELFRRAAEYLEDPPAVNTLGERYVPPKKRRKSGKRSRS